MVINDFYIVDTIASPHKTDPPLVIDTYAVLACSVAAQQLKTVSGWNPKIFQVR
jgi:hypothetical protein